MQTIVLVCFTDVSNNYIGKNHESFNGFGKLKSLV